MRRLLVFPALLACACDPTHFDGLRDRAPVWVISTPAGDTGAFGATLTTYTAEVNGRRVSRIAVAGGSISGPGTEYNVFYGFDGDDDDAVPRFTDGVAFEGCDIEDCGVGFGRSIAAFPEWHGVSGTVLRGCIAFPATETGLIHVRCEERVGFFQNVIGPSGEALGASAAGISYPDHGLGAALLGAPEAGSGSGTIYRLPDDGGGPIRLDLSAFAVPPGGHVGVTLAVAPISGNAIFFAAGTRYDDSETQRILVGMVSAEPGGGIRVEPRGCMRGEPGWGRALAWGDLDRDGMPDLIVGTNLVSTMQRIEIYNGNDFAAIQTCDDEMQPVPARIVRCSDVESPDVLCMDANGEFGTAVATGDVDGDAVLDLLVGAPGATVRGHSAAGAIFVLAGVGGSLERLGERHAAVFSSTARVGMRLGETVGAIRGRGRDEIVAGAPAVREVQIFLCSGIDGDRPSDVGGRRGCIPM